MAEGIEPALRAEEETIELESPLEFRAPSVAHADGLAYAARIGIERGGAPAALLESFVRDLRSDQLELPVLPDSVARVMPLIGDSEVDLGELARIVELDPALALKVVGVANSAYYRGVDRAGSVHDALMRMGLAQARNIVLAVALQSSVFKVPGFEREAQSIWLHSLFSALAAEALLAKRPPWAGRGFLLGISHDVGRIALLQFAAQERKRHPGAHHVRPPIVEEVASLLHERLSAYAVKTWAFSEEFVHVLANHHHPRCVKEATATLAHALAAADRLAHWLAEGGGSNEAEVPPDLLEQLAELEIDAAQAGSLARDVHAQFEALANFV